MTLLDIIPAREAIFLAFNECADWLTRDDRTRGSEPVGFRSGGEVGGESEIIHSKNSES